MIKLRSTKAAHAHDKKTLKQRFDEALWPVKENAGKCPIYHKTEFLTTAQD